MPLCGTKRHYGADRDFRGQEWDTKELSASTCGFTDAAAIGEEVIGHPPSMSRRPSKAGEMGVRGYAFIETREGSALRKGPSYIRLPVPWDEPTEQARIMPSELRPLVAQRHKAGNVVPHPFSLFFV
jgi:hypothetical protein